MGILRTHRRRALWIGALLVALLVTGCAGIKPYEPRDWREEGPKKGLLTGPEGEFVIFRKVDEPEKTTEASKPSDKIADGEEQKTDSEKREKKAETNSRKQ